MILIVFVALMLFGGEKLPEIARGLGKGIRDFKDASEGVKREITNQINSYEERRTDEPVTPVAEAPKEFTADDEHKGLLLSETNAHEPEATVHEHDVPNPIAEIQGVPHTIPFNENHVPDSGSHINEEHKETSNTVAESKTEPVKTTHE